MQNDPDERVYLLSQVDTSQGKAWHLSMKRRTLQNQWIRLALPGADPVFGPDSATLSYRNANGGRLVNVRAGKDGATLDVFVSHGLEIDIDADLDPRVDALNTEGPLTNVSCTVTSP